MTHPLPLAQPSTARAGRQVNPMSHRAIVLIALAAIAIVVSVTTALGLLGTAFAWPDLAAALSFMLVMVFLKPIRHPGMPGLMNWAVRIAVSAFLALALWSMLAFLAL